MNDDLERRPHWHFEKRLSLDTVVSICGLAILLGAPLLLFALRMDTRVQALEFSNAAGAKSDENTARRLGKIDDRLLDLQLGMARLSTQIDRSMPSQDARDGRK